MSESITVPFEAGKQGDQAVLLLAAAEELGLEANVVGTTEGAFVAPAEVVDKAFGDRSEASPKKAPAKKSAAKKSTANKAQE